MNCSIVTENSYGYFYKKKWVIYYSTVTPMDKSLRLFIFLEYDLRSDIDSMKDGLFSIF